MRYFDRKIPLEANTLDTVQSLIGLYPEGITYHRLMMQHPEQLQDASTVLGCIYTLLDERRVDSKGRWSGTDFLGTVHLHCKPH